MPANKLIRHPLWATLLAALVAAMVVSFFVFVQSGEAKQAADKKTYEPHIIGGTEVPNGKYPFVAYVELHQGKRVGVCTGSLIDQDSVLTAAHCLLKATAAKVIVGRTDLRNKNQGQEIGASMGFIHPRYNGNGYDAGVLKLRRPVKGIKPIKLATAQQNYLEMPGHILTAAGWGAVKQRPDIYPYRMYEVSIPVVSDSSAKRAYQQAQEPPYVPSLMVAAGQKGKAPCFGDSGGPLFDSGSRTQVGIDNRYAVHECAAQARYPEVFTEVNNPEIRNFIVSAANR